jgi:hypothetical protein
MLKNSPLRTTSGYGSLTRPNVAHAMSASSASLLPDLGRRPRLSQPPPRTGRYLPR